MPNIKAIPAFNDNYIWLLQNTEETWVVDPGDAQAVIAVLEALNSELTGILVTHHHYDHVGGIEDLTHIYQPQVIGPKKSGLASFTQHVTAGDTVCAAGLDFDVIETPGHTLDHIAYFAKPDHSEPILFCGDTLFGGGCGRIFEGTAGQMYQSVQILADLPDDTRVYCAHEYTLANLSFAQVLEPNNEALEQRLARDRELRKQDRPTVPSTLSEERNTNPFLRCQAPELVSSAQTHTQSTLTDPIDVFACIRAWKDGF